MCVMVDIDASTQVSVEARVRARNQVTIPEPIVRALGLAEGARLLFRADGDRMEIVVLRDSYAGALHGVWGADAQAWLAEERAAWER
jgi:bifunctional DNA-binding transcriptional regulator/antitoxin component of YhaV-PrlF toxin-antitoxin module